MPLCTDADECSARALQWPGDARRRSVKVAGSWDQWEARFPLSFTYVCSVTVLLQTEPSSLSWRGAYGAVSDDTRGE